MNDKLTEIIKSNAKTLEGYFPFVNGAAYLAATAKVESGYGKYNVPKYEKAYDLGGRYANVGYWQKYGSHYACSYSSFQIMYPVACELGFLGSPYDLANDETAILWVLELFKKRGIRQNLSSVDEMADFYNSGSARDTMIPTKYIADIKHHYAIYSENGL